MLQCPMCGDDDLVAVRIPFIDERGAHCPTCDAFWRRGVKVRLRFSEQLAHVLARYGLSDDHVQRDEHETWLADAYRDSRAFTNLCPACEEDDLEIMLVVPLSARIKVCPHCDACWSEAVEPSRKDHGRVGLYLKWQGLTEGDLVSP